MSYLVFATEQQAIAAESMIVGNIADAVASQFPDRYDNGTLVGVDINDTPRPEAARTMRWDAPRECAEGWAIVAPTQEAIGRVPLAVAMAGVGGVAYESVTWVDSDGP